MKKHVVMGVLSGISFLQIPPASAGSVLAIDNPAAHDDTSGAFANIQLFAGDDNLGVPAYLHKWHGAYESKSGDNVGVMSARGEAGVQWKDLRFGYLVRADAMTQMDQKVADLVYLYQNRQPYRAGQTYGGHYQLNAFTADGLHLSDSMEYGRRDGARLTLGAGVSFLRGHQLRLQTVSGQAAIVGPRDFNFSAQMQDNNARQASGSYGYALDAGGRLTLTNGTHIDVAVNDLSGRMYWKDVPVTYGVADSNPSVAVQNGSYSGRKDVHDLTLNLHPKIALGITVPVNHWDLGVNVSGTQGICFPQTEIGYHFRSGWRLGMMYDVRFKSSGVYLANRVFSVAAQAQDWSSLGQSRAYGVAGQLNLHF